MKTEYWKIEDLNKMKLIEGAIQSERERVLKLMKDEKEIVKKVCLGLVHPPQENQEEFTKWLQDTVNFHINQINKKIQGK